MLNAIGRAGESPRGEKKRGKLCSLSSNRRREVVLQLDAIFISVKVDDCST